jgi:hypothetical protein
MLLINTSKRTNLQDIPEFNPHALVGITFGNKVIFNILTNDVQFQNTGLSVVHYLNHNKPEFMSNMILSQHYNNIEYIFDDNFKFGEYIGIDNENVDTFSNIIMLCTELYEYMYIYDFINEKLLVQSPEQELIALDYTNSEDVRKFLNI